MSVPAEKKMRKYKGRQMSTTVSMTNQINKNTLHDNYVEIFQELPKTSTIWWRCSQGLTKVIVLCPLGNPIVSQIVTASISDYWLISVWLTNQQILQQSQSCCKPNMASSKCTICASVIMQQFKFSDFYLSPSSKMNMLYYTMLFMIHFWILLHANFPVCPM